MRSLALVTLLLTAPACAADRDPGTHPAAAAALHALRAAEDARATAPEQLATLRAGLASPSVDMRRVAARGLGRLARADAIPDLTAALGDAAPAVRAAAADGLVLASSAAGADQARSALLARLALESDSTVLATICESLGWIAHTDTVQVRETADALVAHSRTGAGGDAPATVLRGVAHGLFGLARQPVARAGLPATAAARLAELVRYGRSAAGQRLHVEIRELATMALAAGGSATGSTMGDALDDPDRAVRAAATRAIGTLADSVAAERIARRAFADSAPQVRTRAVAAFARRFATRRGCSPYLAALADADLSVRLQAADALAAGCEAGSPAAARLDDLAAALPAQDDSVGAGWHLAAHALVTLAALDPARARARIPAFAGSRSFFVREYAARAAAAVRDTAVLRRLAADPHPNVRTSAIAGLSATIGHAADDAYLAALDSEDSQLLQGAAQALAGSRDARAVPALLAALDRETARRMETGREARLALLDRVRELGDASLAPRLRPYLADFDTLVAARAADALGGWTGSRPAVAPVPLPRMPVPTEAELADLERAQVVLEMADGGTVVLSFSPDAAPTNVARVVQLAGEGKLDGLTFHRAVLPRFVQGGSPAANEYAGWGPYTRDEFALSHRRGAVSMSTRGYDTADGQIVLHTEDNFDYDHRYTVIGRIVSGIEVVDRMQEGARIRRATVRR